MKLGKNNLSKQLLFVVGIAFICTQTSSSFARSHPKFAKAVGPYNTSYSGGKNNMAIYALAMGYNVITADYGGYTNVIDRSALVYRK